MRDPQVHHAWRAEHTTLSEVQTRVAEFLNQRGWQHCHTPKNLAMSIAIEAAELMELFQWVPSEESDVHAQDPLTRRRIEEELADVVIYCFSLSHRLGMDMAAVVDDKMVKNADKYPRPEDPHP